MHIRRFVAAFVFIILSTSYSYSQTTQGLQKYDFNIQQQSVNEALIDLALQQNLNVVFLADTTKSLTANALIGSYTLAEALNLLLEGTKLRASIVNNRVIEIERLVLKPRPFNYKSYYQPLPPEKSNNSLPNPN